MEARQIKELVNEWLETLDTEKGYWDGVFMSNRDMAEKFIKSQASSMNLIKSFFEWLDERYPPDKEISHLGVFTAEQYKQIRKLFESGQIVEAQRLILDNLNKDET